MLYPLKKNINDLNKNAIGVSIPFNNIYKVFNSTYSTKDQIKSNLINLLLTNKGERLFLPNFGCNILRTLFEQSSENILSELKSEINNQIKLHINEINILSIDINSNENNLYININYQLKTSNDIDNITIEI